MLCSIPFFRSHVRFEDSPRVSRPRPFRTAALIIVLLLGALTPILAADAKRCRMCGMDATASQTEFVVHHASGQQERTCCLHCVYLLQKLGGAADITRLETRDFSSGTLVDARRALYLEGATLRPKHSMAPFLLAFAGRDTAERYRKQYQGNIVDFNQAMQIVARFDDETGGGE